MNSKWTYILVVVISAAFAARAVKKHKKRQGWMVFGNRYRLSKDNRSGSLTRAPCDGPHDRPTSCGLSGTARENLLLQVDRNYVGEKKVRDSLTILGGTSVVSTQNALSLLQKNKFPKIFHRRRCQEEKNPTGHSSHVGLTSLTKYMHSAHISDETFFLPTHSLFLNTVSGSVSRCSTSTHFVQLRGWKQRAPPTRPDSLN